MKVLLTHSRGKLEGLEPTLRKLNFNVIHHPAIKVDFINSPQTLAKAKELLKLPWLFFSSRNAIEAWHVFGLPFKNKIAVVGKASAKALAQYQKSADLIAEPQNAKGLLSKFLKSKNKACPVGVLKGNKSLQILENGLAENNCEPQSLVIYQTETLTINETADIVVLASPSAVAALPDKLAQAKLLAIGPSTAKAIREKGWSCQTATSPNTKSIVNTLERMI